MIRLEYGKEPLLLPGRHILTAAAVFKNSLPVALGLGLLGMLGGCDTKSFIDPSEMGRYEREPLAMPILNTVDPHIESKNEEFAGASDPTPDDLKDFTGDYRISRDDVLSVAISDLQGPGQETVKTTRVTESGFISLPFVGAVHAEGLTEIELEQGIIEAYRNANLIQNAQVSVSVSEPRGRAFSILGAVQQPGEYPIAEADFRLLNALVTARGVTSSLVEYAYIIRRSERPHMGSGPTTHPAGGASSPASGPSSDELAPHTEAAPTSHVVHLAADVAPAADAPATQPTTEPSPATAPVIEPAAPETAPAVARTGPGTTAGGAATQPFEFNEPEMPGKPRIIRVPLLALFNGELRYNIVIRPKDMVYVEPLQNGVFYMGGHVQRPGVYNLTQHVTLKNAVVAAGMLDAVAIPQRTDIIRRIRPDHEVFVRIDLDKVFAGQQPDVYLRPDDQVMVGTNALAPFIAAVRGAFRITYGFGFLYDRNYWQPRGNGSGGF